MMYKNKELTIRDIANNQDLKEVADNFLIENCNYGAEFLQSSLWENVLKKEEKNFKRIVIKSSDEIFVNCLIILEKNFLGNYYYSPRGPIFKSGLSDKDKIYFFNLLIAEIKKSENNILFLRFEPGNNFLNTIDKKNIVKVKDIQPAKTLFLDILKSEEDILKDMHQKTRYNIRLAERKGVEIRISENIESDFSQFWDLMKKTGERDSFNIHQENHYLKLLESDKRIKLYFAYYNNKAIATAIISFFGKRVTYIHGASDNEYRNIMAPHLLQFKAITDAKNEGFLFYDFYGIDEIKWPGVTRFKNGFNGTSFDYSGTYDYIFSKRYYLYKILRKIKRFI